MLSSSSTNCASAVCKQLKGAQLLKTAWAACPPRIDVLQHSVTRIDRYGAVGAPVARREQHAPPPVLQDLQGNSQYASLKLAVHAELIMLLRQLLLDVVQPSRQGVCCGSMCCRKCLEKWCW